MPKQTRKKATRRTSPSSPPRSYEHPEGKTPLRPDVGTQAQFRKKKPPQTYRYDSSLSPALNWDGQNPGRDIGEWLISLVDRQPHDYVPDFIVRLKGERLRHVIVEVKGFDPLKEIKQQAAERWVDGSTQRARSASGDSGWSSTPLRRLNSYRSWAARRCLEPAFAPPSAARPGRHPPGGTRREATPARA